MKNLNCKNCGGTMVLDASAMTAVCHYCGTRYLLNHEDTDYFRNFFKQMTSFFAVAKDDQERKKRAAQLWENAEEQEFLTEDGISIEIKYMYRYSDKEAEVYVARRNIVFHFKNDGVQRADLFRKNVSAIDYPTADIRKLSDFFPKISGGFVLEDGSFILVIEKDEDEYPLRLFGTLSGRHVAWVISRMENLCCVLEYNSLVHPEINVDTLYINPYTHQASLYGNWWNVARNHTVSADRRRILTTEENLVGLRKTAAALLGCSEATDVKYKNLAPAAMIHFICSKPCINAYEDFAFWDEMLIKAYGERKFINMDVDDEQIYAEKR